MARVIVFTPRARRVGRCTAGVFRHGNNAICLVRDESPRRTVRQSATAAGPRAPGPMIYVRGFTARARIDGHGWVFVRAAWAQLEITFFRHGQSKGQSSAGRPRHSVELTKIPQTRKVQCMFWSYATLSRTKGKHFRQSNRGNNRCPEHPDPSVPSHSVTGPPTINLVV